MEKILNIFFRGTTDAQSRLILSVNKQIKAWHKANHKMRWGIMKEEFDRIDAPPPLSESDINQGFIGAVLFYGFGDDGCGNADPVLSGKLAWEYARKRWWRKT